MAEAIDPGPIGAFYEWRLQKKVRGGEPEERTYEQSELSIEGEARLLGMARKIGTLLKARDFDLAKLATMVNTGEPDWDLIVDALALITEEAPKVVAESVLILLSIFPTQEDGSPNPDYADHEQFIRHSVNSAKFHDMLRVFITQNDYQRLARPFWNRVSPPPPVATLVDSTEDSSDS